MLPCLYCTSIICLAILWFVLHQGCSTSVLLTFWAGCFFIVGACPVYWPLCDWSLKSNMLGSLGRLQIVFCSFMSYFIQLLSSSLMGQFIWLKFSFIPKNRCSRTDYYIVITFYLRLTLAWCGFNWLWLFPNTTRTHVNKIKRWVKHIEIIESHNTHFLYNCPKVHKIDIIW